MTILNKIKARTFIMCVAIFTMAAPMTGFAAEKVPLPVSGIEEDSQTVTVKNVNYETFDPLASPLEYFEDTISVGSSIFMVTDYTTPTIVSKEKTAPERFLYTSEVFTGDEKDHLPEEEMVLNEVPVRLVSKKLSSATAKERTKHVSQDVTFSEMEEGFVIPEKQAIEFRDVDTDQTVISDMDLISSKESATYWSDNFTFPIRIQGYDANSFVLGDTEIGRDEDLNSYHSAFLEYLGLSPEYYEIEDISWNGDAYIEGDDVCRNAVATGNKLLKDYLATYEGDVTLPEISGYVWECTYETIPNEGEEYTYTMSTDMTLTNISREESWLQRLWNLIKDVLRLIFGFIVETVSRYPAASITLLAIISFAIAFLLIRAAKKERVYTVTAGTAAIREYPSDTARELSYVVFGDKLHFAHKKENGYIMVYIDKEKLTTGWIKRNDIEEFEDGL